MVSYTQKCQNDTRINYYIGADNRKYISTSNKVLKRVGVFWGVGGRGKRVIHTFILKKCYNLPCVVQVGRSS